MVRAVVGSAEMRFVVFSVSFYIDHIENDENEHSNNMPILFDNCSC
jgi:hypothetical protein